MSKPAPLRAVLPAGHRLTGKEQIAEADLAGEPVLWDADTSTQHTKRPHPDAGYRVRGVDETLEHVAAAGASRSWPVRRPYLIRIRRSAMCPSRIWRPTRCASLWRNRALRR
jgi:hypothetical protein